MDYRLPRLSLFLVSIIVIRVVLPQLGVSNAASSQLIDRLVLQGLIERTEDPTDRRAKCLTIRGKGKALVEWGITARTQWMEGLTTKLTPEQQSTVIAALIMLTDSASKVGKNRET